MEFPKKAALSLRAPSPHPGTIQKLFVTGVLGRKLFWNWAYVGVFCHWLATHLWSNTLASSQPYCLFIFVKEVLKRHFVSTLGGPKFR